VFTNLFINMGVAQGLWLLNERRAIISLWKTIVGAVIAILGNWLFIPKFGIAGVAVIAVLAQLGSAILTNLLFSKRIFLMQIRSLIWPVFKL
jgi:O-antigen/teichoic acid export membrane protein